MHRNGGGSQTDPSDGVPAVLDLYLEELSRYPLLTPPEEESTARLAQTGDPEAFRERPGEAAAGGGFGGMSEMSTIVDLIMPGEGFAGLMRRFENVSTQGDLVEPGTYTLTMSIGDRTFTQTLEITRKGEFRGENAPFSLFER